MTTDAKGLSAGEEWVVVASFDSYRHAEHMLASLGRQFRRASRHGDISAVVVRRNADGSLTLTQSRVLEAGELGSVLIRLSLAWSVGFLGLLSIGKGTKGEVHAVHIREGHVGSEEHQVHEILAEAGPNATVVLVRGRRAEMQEQVVAAATDSASRSWSGSLAYLVAHLDPGSDDDWVRAVLSSPPPNSPNK